MLNIDLSKRVALVTGATGQLGRVIVTTLAACGADIIIHFYRNKEKAEELYNNIKQINRDVVICSFYSPISGYLNF